MRKLRMAVLPLVAFAGLAAAAEKNAESASPVLLTVGRIEEIRADETSEITVTMFLHNVSHEPLYVSPVPGEIAGALEILATPEGSKARPVRLYSRSRPYSGYAFEDLFRLMPGRMQRYSLVVTYRPLFKGEGTIELWVKYDPSEMAKGNTQAFALPLESEHVEIPVRKARVKRY